MAVRPNLVNKQFNSPINMYSQANIHDALAKQSHTLYNGAVGIDFHNLAKPGNLANSAVLRMLEEEETSRSGRKPGLKRVAWPPPPEEQNNTPIQASEPIIKQGSIRENLSGPPKQEIQGNKGREDTRAEVKSPPVYHIPVSFEPPKATVTLLPQAPIRQEAPPVFASQPATTSVQGGIRMRGDQKWPPESVKQQAAAENQARIALAKGPTCRPRRIKKDYSTFFAQHALNPTYPGYKAPPGTQHYIEEGTSNL